jgi:hypothetical protein
MEKTKERELESEKIISQISLNINKFLIYF